MKINNVIFNGTFETPLPPSWKRCLYTFFGNTLQITRTSYQLYMVQNHKYLIFDHNLNQILKRRLEKITGQQQNNLETKIINFQASATLNYNQQTLISELLRTINKRLNIEDIDICQEQNIYHKTTLLQLINSENLIYIGISIKLNGGRITARFQLTKPKDRVHCSCIISLLNNKTEELIRILNDGI